MPEQKIYLDDNGNPMPPPKVYLDENGNPLGAAAGPQPSALEALKAQVATYPKDIGSSTGFTSAFTGSVPPEKQTGPMAAVGRLARSPLDMLKMAAAPADPSKGELETPGAPIGLQRVIGSQVGLLASGLKGLTRTPDPDAIGTQTRMNAGQPSPRDLENLHAAGETLAGATPLAGPWAANMGERAGRGDLSGTATEFAGGLAAPKALHGVIDLAKDASGAYSVPKPKALAPAASPAESVNPLQAYHAASEHGIDMLPAQVSDSRVAKIADSIGKRAVFDLGDLKGKGERQNIALSKWHQDAGNQVDPGGTAQNTESIGRDLQAGAEARYAAEKAAVAARGPNVPGVASTIMDGMAPRASAEEVAGKVQNRLQATVAQLGHQADSIFGDLDTKARGVTVAASNGQKLAQKIIQENGSYYEKFPSVAPTQALKLLQRIASTDKPLTFTEAQKLRSDALELARNNPDIFKGKPAGWLSGIAGALDEDIMTASTGLPKELQTQFRQANGLYSEIKTVFDDPRSKFYDAVRNKDPNSVTQKFIPQSGGSPQLARQAKIYLGDDTATLKREFVERLIDPKRSGTPDYAGVQDRLNGYGEGYLNELFTPAERAQLRSFSETAKIDPFEGLEKEWHGPGSQLKGLVKPANGFAKDAAKVPGSLMQPGNYGGSLEAIRALKAKQIDLSGLQREVLNNIHGDNYAVKDGKLGGYSHAFLSELLPPETVTDLYKRGTVARQIGFGKESITDHSRTQAHQAQLLATGAALGSGYVPAAVGILGFPAVASKIAGMTGLAKFMMRGGTEPVAPPAVLRPEAPPGGLPPATGPVGPPASGPPPILPGRPGMSLNSPPVALGLPNSSAVGPVGTPVGLARVPGAPRGVTWTGMRSRTATPEEAAKVIGRTVPKAEEAEISNGVRATARRLDEEMLGPQPKTIDITPIGQKVDAIRSLALENAALKNKLARLKGRNP